MKRLNIAFVLALLVLFAAACGNENSKTKSLDEVDQSQETMDPELMKDNRSANDPNSNNPEPKFKFKQSTWNFGTVVEGMQPTFVFKFTNVGNGNLVISKAEASCGCTTPQWPKEPIPPGGEGEIHVKFNSTGKHGKQHKNVTLYANTNPPQTILLVQGEVVKE